MGFLHLSLLLGLGFAAMPILLHFMSKKQPKRMPFPAVRFVRQTMVVAQRGWKVKHWLLLFLRVMLLAMLVLALAAPRIHSGMLATYLSIGLVLILAVFASVATLVAYASHRPQSVQGAALGLAALLWLGGGGWLGYAMLHGEAPPTTNASGPIATVLVIDTSPTMDYRSANQTRLDQAKEIGQWLIDRLPVESQIAILAQDQGGRLSQDRSAASRQLERVALQGRAASLARRVRAAVELVRASSLERREVYVLTDHNAASWRDAAQAELTSFLKQDPKVLVQIVDVGTATQGNWTLATPRVSQESVGPNGTSDLELEVVSSSNSVEQQISLELYREPIDVTLPVERNGKLILPTGKVIDRQILDMPPNATRKVRFRLRDLSLGTHHFQVRLSQPDPLAIDNQLYVTVEARPQRPTLVHANDPAIGEQLMGIVDPEWRSVTDMTQASVKLVPSSDLASLALSQFSCLLLHDPTNLSALSVERIEEFVGQGGGVFLALGAGFENETSLNASPVAKLLPGPVARLTRRPNLDASLVFVPVQVNHPVFFPFEKLHEEGIWNAFSVFRHWDIDALKPEASTLMRYSINGKPALIEERRGQGRIITLTTPIPEAAAPTGRKPWNDLWGANAWPSYALLLGIQQSLSGSSKARFNYLVGEPVSLDNASEMFPPRYEMFMPDGTIVRADSNQGTILVAQTATTGTYRLRGIHQNQPIVRGFTVNIDRDDLRLQPMEPENWDAVLGKDQYHIASEKEEVLSSLGQARFGRDLAPFLMVLVAVLFLLEQAMSSRFYSLRMGAGRADAASGRRVA